MLGWFRRRGAVTAKKADEPGSDGDVGAAPPDSTLTPSPSHSPAPTTTEVCPEPIPTTAAMATTDENARDAEGEDACGACDDNGADASGEGEGDGDYGSPGGADSADDAEGTACGWARGKDYGTSEEGEDPVADEREACEPVEIDQGSTAENSDYGKESCGDMAEDTCGQNCEEEPEDTAAEVSASDVSTLRAKLLPLAIFAVVACFFSLTRNWDISEKNGSGDSLLRLVKMLIALGGCVFLLLSSYLLFYFCGFSGKRGLSEKGKFFIRNLVTPINIKFNKHATALLQMRLSLSKDIHSAKQEILNSQAMHKTDHCSLAVLLSSFKHLFEEQKALCKPLLIGGNPLLTALKDISKSSTEAAVNSKTCTADMMFVLEEKFKEQTDNLSKMQSTLAHFEGLVSRLESRLGPYEPHHDSTTTSQLDSSKLNEKLDAQAQAIQQLQQIQETSLTNMSHAIETLIMKERNEKFESNRPVPAQEGLIAELKKLTEQQQHMQSSVGSLTDELNQLKSVVLKSTPVFSTPSSMPGPLSSNGLQIDGISSQLDTLVKCQKEIKEKVLESDNDWKDVQLKLTQLESTSRNIQESMKELRGTEHLPSLGPQVTSTENATKMEQLMHEYKHHIEQQLSLQLSSLTTQLPNELTHIIAKQSQELKTIITDANSAIINSNEALSALQDIKKKLDRGIPPSMDPAKRGSTPQSPEFTQLLSKVESLAQEVRRFPVQSQHIVDKLEAISNTVKSENQPIISETQSICSKLSADMNTHWCNLSDSLNVLSNYTYNLSAHTSDLVEKTVIPEYSQLHELCTALFQAVNGVSAKLPSEVPKQVYTICSQIMEAQKNLPALISQQIAPQLATLNNVLDVTKAVPARVETSHQLVVAQISLLQASLKQMSDTLLAMRQSQPHQLASSPSRRLDQSGASGSPTAMHRTLSDNTGAHKTGTPAQQLTNPAASLITPLPLSSSPPTLLQSSPPIITQPHRSEFS
ncbi:hypothetical protein Pelo_16196 [Pelomyxa schiedti]|nr:hypothetical protein Pelo_16196 [Pelomyxa schiedti]